LGAAAMAFFISAETGNFTLQLQGTLLCNSR